MRQPQTTRNLIHIVLDMFPTYTFVEILDSDRPAFDRDWSGFSFFANTSAPTEPRWFHVRHALGSRLS